MQMTFTVAGSVGSSPFEMFEADTDDVIMTINYILLLGERGGEVKATPTPARAGKETRIRVNDKTATGGWF